MARLSLIVCLILAVFTALPGALPGKAHAGGLEFQLPTPDGKQLKLSDFRGRVVVLDFFATWCRPCRAYVPKLNRLRAKYGERGLSVIGFALDKQGIKKVRPYMAKNKVAFPVVMGDLAEARRLANVEVLPTSIVIGPQGRVLARFEGVVSAERMMAAVRPHLRSDAPPEPPEAMVAQRDPGQNRFLKVWVDDNQIFGGTRGVMVHALLDVADQVSEQGLWLTLNLLPESRNEEGGLIPQGEPKKLYQRVQDVSRRHFALFVRCDQLPPVPVGGVYRSWLGVINAKHKSLGRSGDFIVHSTTCLAAQAK